MHQRAGSGRRPGARLACAILVALHVAWPHLDAGAEELRIVGSDTLAGLLVPIARRFETGHPGVTVRIEAKHSSAGPPALLGGQAQIASLSRPMRPDELAALEARLGAQPEAFVIAIDALAIYVNAANPLEKISLQELDAIYSTTRRCGAPLALVRWRQLGVKGELADRPIGLYGHPKASGTYATFRDAVLCGGRFRDDIREQPGARSLLFSVAEGPTAIGYGPMSGQTVDGVKAVRVSVKPGYQYGRITPEDVYDDVYPLTRELFLYRLAPVPGRASDARVTAFLQLVLSDEGQDSIEAAGFLRLPPDAVADARAKLDAGNAPD